MTSRLFASPADVSRTKEFVTASTNRWRPRGAGIVEDRAQRFRPALAQVFKLMADEKSHQLRHAEARDHPRCAIADSRRVIEGRIELGACNCDSGGAVAQEKSVKPMRRPVERAAEIE